MPTKDPPTPDPAAAPTTADVPAAAPTLGEQVAAEAAAQVARTAGQTLARGALDAVGKAADGALDAVETLLFGKVGAAEEAVAREKVADPIDRLRAQYGLGPRAGTASGTPAAPPVAKEDPVEVAKRQLEELKRQRATPPGEVKKTL